MAEENRIFPGVKLIDFEGPEAPAWAVGGASVLDDLISGTAQLVSQKADPIGYIGDKLTGLESGTTRKAIAEQREESWDKHPYQYGAEYGAGMLATTPGGGILKNLAWGAGLAANKGAADNLNRNSFTEDNKPYT